MTVQSECIFKIANETSAQNARKSNSPRQQPVFKCMLWDYVSKKHGPLVLHSKEAHMLSCSDMTISKQCHNEK